MSRPRGAEALEKLKASQSNHTTSKIRAQDGKPEEEVALELGFCCQGSGEPLVFT